MTWTVRTLTSTPVKGLAINHPHQLEVSTSGVVGDRAFYLVDEAGGLISCTRLGALLAHRAEYDPGTGVLSVHGPDGPLQTAPARPGDPVVTDFFGLRSVPGNLVDGWHDVFSDLAGRPVRLVRAGAGAYDVAGLTLVGRSSVAELAARNGAAAVDARRFRMTIEIAGTEPHEEDGWAGRELQLGEVAVVVGGPVKRCAATTRDPDTGRVDLQTLQMIARYRGRQATVEWGVGSYFGVYAEVLAPGLVRVGDPVTLVSSP